MGPDHLYVAPAINSVESISVAPSHSGPLFEIAGVAGIALTTTFVVEVWDAQLLTVAIKLYVPALTPRILFTVGLCADDVNPFGPIQLYDAPAIRSVERFSVDPSHKGPLFERTGAAGIGLITTLVADDNDAQLLTVATSLYVPAFRALTLVIDGFCNDDVKPPGPLQL
ncbi:MAG: hypothetical protein NVS3B19_10180 [Ginsengibacter sp.]